MESSSTAETELPVKLFVHPIGSGPISMHMQYVAYDPLAVHATFALVGNPATAVHWVLSRDVLIEGLKRPAGLGDLRVWPDADREPSLLYIALGPAGESALIEASHQDVELFLGRTQSLVPQGSEHEQFDIETELACLLSS
ncbi:SsgA family sporulation/cell division regulator [Streptomyces sp. NPDC048171]|uniref:SsgA family sporulation/cell division regulator n=1 Tax=Streptomyces sp. NPDC048171 TaxID=3365504 RepID=UPI003724B40B